MKDIDLTGYTESELLELNRRIVERIRALHQDRCRSTMSKVNLGDRVSFHPECGHEVVGTLVRLNKKSVTVVTAEGVQWRVAPGVLKKRESDHQGFENSLAEKTGNLIEFATHQPRGKAWAETRRWQSRAGPI